MKLLSYLSLIILLFTFSCSNPNNEEIEALLSKREEALETKNLDLYMTLIAPEYSVEDGNKVVGREEIEKKFLSNVTLFDTLDLTTANRSIYERDGVIEVVQLTVVDASVSDTSRISGGKCDGKSLDLNNAKKLASIAADDSGTAIYNIKVPADYADRKVHLQAYAETSSGCEISNQVTQIVKSMPDSAPEPVATSVPTSPVLSGFTPNVAGENNSLTVTGLPPGSIVFFNYSLEDATKNRFKVNDKIHLSQIDGKWFIVKESDADFLTRFVFGGSK